MDTSRSSLVVPAAALTARDLIGGLVFGVALGAAVAALPMPLILGRGLAGVVTLSVTLAAGWVWGRDVALLVRHATPAATARSTALLFGPAVLIVGAVLAAIEPIAVPRATRAGFSVHAVYTVLFIPATAFVAAMGAFALGRGLDGSRTGLRFAGRATLAAVVAFLAVDAAMYTLGWRVGAPNAGRRATMLVVTVLGATAAATAAGAAIGTLLRAPAGRHDEALPRSIE